MRFVAAIRSVVDRHLGFFKLLLRSGELSLQLLKFMVSLHRLIPEVMHGGLEVCSLQNELVLLYGDGDDLFHELPCF